MLGKRLVARAAGSSGFPKKAKIQEIHVVVTAAPCKPVIHYKLLSDAMVHRKISNDVKVKAFYLLMEAG